MRISSSQKTMLGLLLLVLLIALVSLYWLKAIHPYESTDNSYLKTHISLISPKVTGYVKEVLLKDNQKVMPGDVLVVIDDQDFKARVRQAEAQVLAESAHILTLEADKRTQSARRLQEKAGVAAADAGLERISKDLKRFGNLVSDGAVSLQTNDTAAFSQKQAVAERQKVVSSLAEAESGYQHKAGQIL